MYPEVPWDRMISQSPFRGHTGQRSGSGVSDWIREEAILKRALVLQVF